MTFMLLMTMGREPGSRTLKRISFCPPPRDRISLIFSGSIWTKPVYRVRMEPNTATDTAAVMMVRMLLPSQTMSRGARADLGRLFNRTRKGSKI